MAEWQVFAVVYMAKGTVRKAIKLIPKKTMALQRPKFHPSYKKLP
jgi:hypothetical protein